jgi:hypothetical protein
VHDGSSDANLHALLSKRTAAIGRSFSLVQWPLLRNFSDQLNCGRVETCLLLFFGQILLRVLTAATRELVASLMPFLGQPRSVGIFEQPRRDSSGPPSPTSFGRIAGRTSVASIRQREQSRSVFDHGAEARNSRCEDIAVAVKEYDNRLPSLRRDVPSDHLLAVGRIENNLREGFSYIA